MRRFITAILLFTMVGQPLLATSEIKRDTKSRLRDRLSILEFHNYEFQSFFVDGSHNGTHVTMKMADPNPKFRVATRQEESQENKSGEEVHSFNLNEVLAYVIALRESKEEAVRTDGLLEFAKIVAENILEFEIPVIGQVLMVYESIHLGHGARRYINLLELERQLQNVRKNLEDSTSFTTRLSTAALRYLHDYLDKQ